MDQVHNFTYGWITPVFAFLMSFLGSLLGLISTARARATSHKRRRAWLLVLAAWAIGGTGIWVMHFMGMIGFSVPNSPLLYDVPTTVASFLLAVIFVGIGLFIVGYGRPSAAKVLIAGPIVGIAVAGMHYTGTSAMMISGNFRYDHTLVAASIAIAIVAATVALWFTVTIKTGWATFAAALVMAVAISGMHYTGMSAMHAHISETGDIVSGGVDVNWFLAPIVLFVLVVVVALVSAVMATPSDDERAREAQLRDALSRTTFPEPQSTFGGPRLTQPAPGAGPGPGSAFVPRAANGIAEIRNRRNQQQ